MRTLVLLLACLSILAVTPRVRAEPPLKLDARNLALVGALKNPGQWEAYKRAFITAQGRVVDTGNGDISHSEGQGYGMLLAVAANDRAAFDLIWGWTRANLMVRPDALFAWRWEANARPAVADFNDAADGDILIAWALSEAGEAWRDAAYRVAARRTATDVAHKLIVKGAASASLLLPGTVGFSAKDRRDGPVANLSYWVFPAFARLKLVAPEVDWDGLTQSGLDLIRSARFGATNLPADWISTANALRPAENFAPIFGYDAIRIPLYLAWAGVGERDDYAPFAAIWRGREPTVVELSSGRSIEPMGEPGYRAVAALTQCVISGSPVSGALSASQRGESYYSATLRMLVLVAAQMRYVPCQK